MTSLRRALVIPLPATEAENAQPTTTHPWRYLHDETPAADSTVWQLPTKRSPYGLRANPQ